MVLEYDADLKQHWLRVPRRLPLWLEGRLAAEGCERALHLRRQLQVVDDAADVYREYLYEEGELWSADAEQM